MKDATFEIEGMNCNHCVNAVKNLIEEVDGVKSAIVELNSNEAQVLFEDNDTTAEAIEHNINSSNIYKATKK